MPMVEVASPPNWALATELRRVQDQEASQRRLLEILQLELTALCEQFCEDLNDSSRRLDQARLLLATALTKQTELEAEAERQHDTFSQLHCCVQELEAAGSPELASTVDSLVQIGLQSEATNQTPLDRQGCMEFLRQESKWWSIEEVLNSFEERVNVRFEASAKGNPGASPSKLPHAASDVPSRTRKNAIIDEAAELVNTSGIVTAGKISSNQVQQIGQKGPNGSGVAEHFTEASLRHIDFKPGARSPALYSVF
eukprot:gnl/MRDRNA2_/MRDRNA2_30752_c0_seq1.p1 gnl/MRDRNA2_/MRDRNA2_30752_c0~~gnl/MRDRNA2_/MRDRNA2_30752_c0_seq1.p1  ORF type:complete len:254 (-),score=59.60 gnl/MRDRNA2_/MRDRNA2_30752_c0_seq1:212-973(-)